MGLNWRGTGTGRYEGLFLGLDFGAMGTCSWLSTWPKHLATCTYTCTLPPSLTCRGRCRCGSRSTHDRARLLTWCLPSPRPTTGAGLLRAQPAPSWHWSCVPVAAWPTSVICPSTARPHGMGTHRRNQRHSRFHWKVMTIGCAADIPCVSDILTDKIFTNTCVYVHVIEPSLPKLKYFDLFQGFSSFLLTLKMWENMCHDKLHRYICKYRQNMNSPFKVKPYNSQHYALCRPRLYFRLVTFCDIFSLNNMNF